MVWANKDLTNTKIKKCKNCGAGIVWLKSKKGKFYPVDFNGLIDVLTTDFHKCGVTAISLGRKPVKYVTENGVQITE